MEVEVFVANRVSPFYMGIRKWLRNRRWFWPPALWVGLKWLFKLGEHPLVRIAEILISFLPLFGVALVLRLHIDVFVAILFVLVFLFAIWAKGARLKWLSDLERPRSDYQAMQPMQLAPGAHEVRHEKGRTIVRPITDNEAKESDD